MPLQSPEERKRLHTSANVRRWFTPSAVRKIPFVFFIMGRGDYRNAWMQKEKAGNTVKQRQSL